VHRGTGPAGQVTAHLLLRAGGHAVVLDMHHHWKFRDGKICYVRSSEDTAQVAAALTP
jgi:ketosteroid isomerase-like protein